jgi:hypothetical protein
VLVVLAEFYTRRAQLLSRTVKHVISEFTRDLPVELVQQVLPLQKLCGQAGGHIWTPALLPLICSCMASVRASAWQCTCADEEAGAGGWGDSRSHETV